MNEPTNVSWYPPKGDGICCDRHAHIKAVDMHSTANDHLRFLFEEAHMAEIIDVELSRVWMRTQRMSDAIGKLRCLGVAVEQTSAQSHRWVG